MWLSAQDKRRAIRPDDSRAACLGCQIGARHAGVDLEVADRAARQQELAETCVRCGAVGRRMVRKVHCVGCYNRLREARIGRDGRGRPPKFAASLHPVSLVLTGIGPSELTAHYQRCTSRPEAILLAAREAEGQVISVGFRRLAPLPPEAIIEWSPDFTEVMWKPRLRRQRFHLRQALSRFKVPATTLPPFQLDLDLFHA